MIGAWEGPATTGKHPLGTEHWGVKFPFISAASKVRIDIYQCQALAIGIPTDAHKGLLAPRA